MRYEILEDKVLDYLYDHATVTQVVGVLEDGEEDLEEASLE